MDRGWSPKRKAFAQHEGAAVLDAAVLMLVSPVKFISADRPKWLSTLDELTTRLGLGLAGLPLRPGNQRRGVEEGTFTV